jgi:ubiquitin-conjugating enzyme E2 H
MMAGYDVELKNGNTRDFFVEFLGPKDTPYEGGVFKVRENFEKNNVGRQI